MQRGEHAVLNSKLVYFLLSLILTMTGYIGHTTIENQNKLGAQVTKLQESVLCLRGDLEGFKNVHAITHEVLDDKLQTLQSNRR